MQRNKRCVYKKNEVFQKTLWYLYPKKFYLLLHLNYARINRHKKRYLPMTDMIDKLIQLYIKLNNGQRLHRLRGAGSDR